MSYRIVIHPKALKEIKKLPLQEIRKIEAKSMTLLLLPALQDLRNSSILVQTES